MMAVARSGGFGGGVEWVGDRWRPDRWICGWSGVGWWLVAARLVTLSKRENKIGVSRTSSVLGGSRTRSVLGGDDLDRSWVVTI